MLACAAAASFAPAACTSRTAPAPPAPVRLAAVEALPDVPLPAAVAAVSPRGAVEAGAQIRVVFRDDAVPLEALDAPDRQTLLARFALEPAVPGRFIALTPRMIGFQADAPLPLATRFRVTLRAGLADLHGHALDHDYAWTFTTPPIELSTNLPADPSAELAPSERIPKVTVVSNVPLDEASLAEHARFAGADDATAVVQSELVPTPAPTGTAAGSERGADRPEQFAYVLRPSTALASAAAYRFELTPGILPRDGNLGTAAAVLGRLRTYGPLAYVAPRTQGDPAENGGEGRFADGFPAFAFTNPLDPKSVASSVHLDPPPAAGVVAFAASEGAPELDLNPAALEPNRHYTVTFDATLADAFGQTLGTPQQAAFDTGNLAADLWAPSGETIFPSTRGIDLAVSTRNLPERYRTRFARIEPRDLAWFDPQDDDAIAKRLGDVAAWDASAAPPRSNESVETRIPLRARLDAPTGMLAYGVSGRTNRYRDEKGRTVWAEPRYLGVVQLSNVGIFAQWFPNAGLVLLHHLADGSPIARGRVEIYESLLETKATDARPPCATGETDVQGVLQLDGAAFARCASTATNANEAPSLLVIARDGEDWSYVRTGPYSVDWSSDAYFGWSAGAPIARGAIVPDRDLYQPGEDVHATGVAYFETNGVLARGRAAEYALALEGPNGSRKSLGTATLDEFGAFSTHLNLDRRQELGYYTLHAKAANGEELYGSFRVAEFRPPNFKTNVTLDRAFAFKGTAVTANVASAYLFGAPLANARAHLSVTRSRTWFSPPGFERFSFGREWLYPEEAPSVTSDVLDADATLDASGRLARTFTIDAAVPYPLAYRVDAQTTDVANLAVDDTATLTVLPGETSIGIATPFVAEAGTPFAVEAVVSDPQGHAVSDRRIKLTLSERVYERATQIVEGGETPADAVHYRDVQSVEVNSAATPQKVQMTAPGAGEYRVRANFADATDDATATDRAIWVTGAGNAGWGPQDAMTLPVKLDKAEYRVGETATALVESPFPEADLYVAVVRHDVIWKQVATVKGNAPRVQFQVTPAMLPNAALQAVLVRRGTPLGRGDAPDIGKLARIGFVPFKTALDDKYLALEIVPQANDVLPGGEQTVRLRLKDRAGRPVAGEIALAVVNDAVLQLSGYRFPDLVSLVYAPQAISTRYGDNRAIVQLAAEKRMEEKGFGFGGGAEAGAAGTRLRTDFRALAFYVGAVRTDARGEASVHFRLPDDLTTWRVLAMSFTRDARFGRADATFVATKPLVTNPILPQFARPGDRFSAGVSVTNVAQAAGSVSVAGTLAGGLAFLQGERSVASATLESPIEALTQGYRFDVRVDGADDAKVAFRTQLGANADAFEVPLPIRSTDLLESVVATGATADRAQIPLNVASDARTDLGGLDATLASTLLPYASEAIRAALTGELPFGTEVAARVAVASDAIALEKRTGRTSDLPALRSALARNLASLRALALADGGFAAWPGATRSEIFSTAFAASALARAKAAGEGVDPDIARVSGYLRKRLADPCEGRKKCPDSERDSVRLEALETLGTLGDVRSSYLDEIVAGRAQLSYYENVELARHMLKLPAYRTAALALRDKLLEQVHETGRSATVDVPGDYLETRVAGQAQIVQLLLDSAAPVEEIDRAFRALLATQTNGTWPCGSDAAEAFDALAGYAALDRVPPDFTARIALAGKEESIPFHGYAQPLAERTFPAAALPKGSSTLDLSKSGAGTLHYAVAYRYALAGPQAGRYQGIRIDRIVRPANSADPVATFGLGVPGAATLAAGAVFDIEDRIVTDHPIDRVVIDDPLAAGLEAIDTSFRTSTTFYQPQLDAWEITYQQIYRDRVLAYADHLQAGVFAVHYLVRSQTPGTFAWPGAEVHLQYAPEEFGRTAATVLTIAAPK